MTDDPNAAVLDYFQARRQTLLDEIMRRQSALEEVEAAIAKLTDGRSTVNRQRRTRGNSTAADGERLGNTAPSQFHPDATAGDGL